MRKIKSVKQLNDHKQYLSHRLGELDQTMHRQWKELKTILAPSTIVGDYMQTVVQKKADCVLEHGSLLKNLFTYGAGILAGKLVDKVSKKFSGNSR